MYDREFLQMVIWVLEKSPAAAVIGPRRIGKTTLALEIAKTHPSVYLNLGKAQDLEKLQDLSGYLQLHADKLLILDEVQCAPSLFTPLRRIIDARLREMQESEQDSGQDSGRILMFGTSLNKLLRRTARSSAERIPCIELTGLNPLEIEDSRGPSLEKLWMRGGFPESYAAPDDSQSSRWRRDFIRTCLERDIPERDISQSGISVDVLMRLWTILADMHGKKLNVSGSAGALGIKRAALTRGLDIMSDLGLIRRLSPWAGNAEKRRAKPPRIYIRDSGILHELLRIPDYESLLVHPAIHKSWEGFVIEHILANLPSRIKAFFYRTAAGAEINLLLQFSIQHHWALAVQAERTPSLPKGFDNACRDASVRHKFAVYPGVETFAMDHGATALPLDHFIEILRSH